MPRENAAQRRARRAATAEKKKRKAKKEKEKQKQSEASEDKKSIEDILAEIEAESQAKAITYSETLCLEPSPRSYCSLCAFEERGGELLLFGGERNDGRKTITYNELYSFSISKNHWRRITVPNPPHPRSGHQAVVTPGSEGSMFIFGGEFTSPSGNEFYHFKDFWRISLGSDRKLGWEKIEAKGGPSARSGHRMTFFKGKILSFGGFQDNNKSTPKYFNDIHIFDTSEYKWTKLSFPAIAEIPDPRSAAQVFATSDGLFVHGGYSISRVKGEVFKSTVHEDSWLLQVHDAKDGPKPPGAVEELGLIWKWAKVRSSDKPPPATGVTVTSVKDLAFSFGGVIDDEEEDAIHGEFQETLHLLKFDNKFLSWKLLEAKHPVKMKGSSDGKEEKEGKSKGQGLPDAIGSDSAGAAEDSSTKSKVESGFYKSTQMAPSPRMNTHMTLCNGMLYLYGGTVELGSRQLTLSDLYSVDVNKMQHWWLHHGNDKRTEEWLGESSSESSSEDEEGD
eukprot:m.87690 g.87690  ORF g.87690 m.87690 type:complete len:506 (+) comp13126_c0_seq2:54-1571(+)